MKKYFFSLAIVAALIIVVSSKVSAQDKFDFGARAGINISNYHFSKSPDNSTTSAEVGILGGLQMDYWVTRAFALCGQFLYIQKGASEPFTQTVGGATVTGTNNVVANYIEIPLEIKYQFGDDSRVRPYLFAGPMIGLLLSANANTVVNGGSSSSSSVKDQFSSTDFGIISNK